MLRIERLCASYGAIEALRDVSLEVAAGEVACLLGANGAGKTTTLNCVSGVVRPTSGRILFEGDDIAGIAPEDIVRRGLVQVPEGREIFADLSVLDNLRLGFWLRRREHGNAALLDQVFDHFPRLKERQRQPAGTLSGGEQQMLMIGRALMSRPKLVMLDEPSLGLSPILVQNVFAIIARLHGAGITFLLVEQNARVALRASARGYIMENGEIPLSGLSPNLLRDPRVVAAYLGG